MALKDTQATLTLALSQSLIDDTSKGWNQSTRRIERERISIEMQYSMQSKNTMPITSHVTLVKVIARTSLGLQPVDLIRCSTLRT